MARVHRSPSAGDTESAVGSGADENFFLRVPQTGAARPRSAQPARGAARNAWSREPPVGRPAPHPDNHNCTVTDVGTLVPQRCGRAQPTASVSARDSFYPEPEPVERFRWVAPEATLVSRTLALDGPPLLCLDVRDRPRPRPSATRSGDSRYEFRNQLAHAAIEGRATGIRPYCRGPPGKAPALTLRASPRRCRSPAG